MAQTPAAVTLEAKAVAAAVVAEIQVAAVAAVDLAVVQGATAEAKAAAVAAAAVKMKETMVTPGAGGRSLHIGPNNGKGERLVQTIAVESAGAMRGTRRVPTTEILMNVVIGAVVIGQVGIVVWNATGRGVQNEGWSRVGTGVRKRMRREEESIVGSALGKGMSIGAGIGTGSEVWRKGRKEVWTVVRKGM